MTHSSHCLRNAAWIHTFAHTLFSYSAGLQWVKGRHSIKFGGEQRVFFNNFWQPDNPTGIFNFSRDVTTSQPNNGLGDDDHRQGNPFATILTGYRPRRLAAPGPGGGG